MDMNILICVLLLSTWKTSCLNTNQSDGSFTTGPKQLEPMETVRRPLFILLSGAMIIAFAWGCICCFHYACGDNEAGMVRKKSLAANSSKSSKISLGKSKRASPRDIEEQSLLLGTDKSSGPSSEGKMTNDIDDGSHEKITIICHVNLNDVIPKDAQISKASKKMISCEEVNLYQLFYAHSLRSGENPFANHYGD